MLDQERSQASFSLEEMSHLIYGNRQRYEDFLTQQSYYDSNSLFKFDVNFYNESRQDQMLKAAELTVKFTQDHKLNLPKNYDANTLCPQVVFISTVHQAMVIPAFNILASDKQIEKWMPDLENFKAMACYAQTELAHGSDVQNLMTTATYDNSTQQFVIHTPCLEATKFWPGELGLNCTHALVFAQLIANGKKHGVHPFFVRIRDQNHQPLAGIKVGDIGPKLGFSTKDNGYLSFDNYRVSVDSLLSRFIKVDKQGQVQQKGNPKVGYASMMFMRNIICDQHTRQAGIALTIAIRYSLYRTQFKGNDNSELRILDYQTQQAKLFPILAEYYACIFGSLRVKHYVEDNFVRVSKRNDFSQLGFTHAVLSGAKANYSYFIANAAEWCRLSCGGHGFAHYSGLPQIFFDMSANITLEGENTILNLQLARYLLKMLQYKHTKPESVPDLFSFLGQETSTVDNIDCLKSLLKLLAYNCSILVQYAANKLMAGANMKETWDKTASIALARGAAQFIPYFNIVCFVDVIENKAKSTKQVLTKLAKLYAIQQLQLNMHGLLMKNLISQSQIAQLSILRDDLLNQIRPDALSLVECQGYSDNTLKSLIAPKDGGYHQNLFDYATKQNSLNTKPHTEGLNYVRKMSEINAKL